MKKILFIHQGRGIGGASICLKELLDEVKDNYNINILCIYDSDAVNYFKKAGYKTDVLNSFFYRRFYTYFYHSEAFEFTITKPVYIIKSIISYILNIFIAPAIIKSYNPDLVHLNSSVLSDWAIASKRYDYKVIIHVREPIAKGFFGLRRKILKFVIKKYTDHIVAISNNNSSRLDLKDKTTLIYDPIRSLPVINSSQIDKDIRYFVYLGGTQPIKGFNILVEALPLIDNDIKIFFAGDIWDYKIPMGNIRRIMFYLRSFNPSLRRLKRNIKTLKKSNNVILLGVVENIYEYINISTALLFPSTRPHFADPVLEAYKIGTPVIVSDVDGMEEIVSRETGMFFKKNNARDLADKINIFANIDSAKTEEYKLNCLKKYSGIQSKNIKIVDVFEPILLA